MKSTTSHEDQFSPEPTPQEEEAWRELEKRQSAPVAAQAQPAVGEEIHVHIEGQDVLTLPLASSGMNAPRFVVHVPAQADHFRDATKMVPSDEDILGCAGVSRLHGDTPAIFGTADIVRFAHCVLKHFAQPQPSGNADCVGCEGNPTGNNVPCAVCGSGEPSGHSGNAGELPPLPKGIQKHGVIGHDAEVYTAIHMHEYARAALAQSSGNSGEDERAAFEAWAGVEYRHEQEYTARDYRMGLEAWKASRAALAAQADVKKDDADSFFSPENMTGLSKDELIRQLQWALCYWLPNIAGDATPDGERCARDAALLYGMKIPVGHEDENTPTYWEKQQAAAQASGLDGIPYPYPEEVIEAAMEASLLGRPSTDDERYVITILDAARAAAKERQ